MALLATPQARDANGVPGDNYCSKSLPRDVIKFDWHEYEPAIRRWENVTRPAPPPTEPNRNGNPRLTAAFDEWMMGLPEGWITDPDLNIPYGAQIKLCGNGVVPQQAELAIRALLNDEIGVEQ